MTLNITLKGADVLWPDGPEIRDLTIADGRVTDAPAGRTVDLSGYMILPGIVDIHGDGFERHLAPRRGAMKDVDQGLIAAEAELAANGITTATLAQFYSWEGGMRGPDFAATVFAGLDAVRSLVDTDLLAQLRFEIPMLDDYAAVEEMITRHAIPYVVFNDHLPHEELSKGKRPPRLTGQALRIGRNPEKHLEYMQALHAGMDQVPAALDALCADLAARGAGDAVVLGAPNTVRGGSHKGNVSATDLIVMGYCDALASDYHYPSLRRAALQLADTGLLDLAGAWGLISSGPARVLGLSDRGDLSPGKRADLVVLDAKTRHICATLSSGRMSYLSGEAARRFIG